MKTDQVYRTGVVKLVSHELVTWCVVDEGREDMCRLGLFLAVVID